MWLLSILRMIYSYEISAYNFCLSAIMVFFDKVLHAYFLPVLRLDI